MALHLTRLLPNPPSPLRLLRVAAVALLAAVLAGCQSPSAANTQLRKDKQALEAQIQTLKSEQAADRATIAALEKRSTTVPSLPQARLNSLFTTHSIKIGRLTGGTNRDPNASSDDTLKVYLTPLDESDSAIKATGRVIVEAFDLAKPSSNRVGRWEFSPTSLKEQWRSLGPLEAFVLDCPLSSLPQHSDLALNITFEDELTGRTFTALHKASIRLPPATRPAVQPQATSSRITH